jgi:single-stranded DNA-binding protein
MNRTMLTGYLARDARLFELGNDRIAANCRILDTTRVRRQGRYVEQTEAFNVRIYASRNCTGMYMDRLVKGAHVFVLGSQRTDTYTDESGAQRQTTYLAIDHSDLEFLDRAGGRNAESAERLGREIRPRGQGSTPVSRSGTDDMAGDFADYASEASSPIRATGETAPSEIARAAPTVSAAVPTATGYVAAPPPAQSAGSPPPGQAFTAPGSLNRADLLQFD